jgi:hypothetical protein
MRICNPDLGGHRRCAGASTGISAMFEYGVPPPRIVNSAVHRKASASTPFASAPFGVLQGSLAVRSSASSVGAFCQRVGMAVDEPPFPVLAPEHLRHSEPEDGRGAIARIGGPPAFKAHQESDIAAHHRLIPEGSPAIFKATQSSRSRTSASRHVAAMKWPMMEEVMTSAIYHQHAL